MSRADRTLDAALAKLAERGSLERLIALYTKRYRLPAAEVADAIQTAFCKMLKAYAGKPLESPAAMLHRVINNELLTVLRRSQVVKLIELDDDYLLVMSHKAHIAEDDDSDGPERVLVWSDEEPEEEADDLASRRAARQVGIRRTPKEEAEYLENQIIETVDVDNLQRTVLQQLDIRYRHVVVLLLEDWTPDELREKFGRNGYRIRVWARVKVCRILGTLAAKGHDLAERLHAQGGCQRILQSLKTGDAAAV
jgi:RNA polymerase sigma factor (sigma-70 family)